MLKYPNMAEKMKKDRRINLRPSAEQLAYLDDLADLGVHGKNATEVAMTLVVIEIERLVREGFVKIRKSKKNRSAPSKD